MSAEQAIQRLKDSSIMSKRCEVQGGKIYANQERLNNEATRCVITNCAAKSKKLKKNSNDNLLFSVDSKDKTKTNETIKSPQKQNQASQQKPPKIKFQPLTCGHDTSCISRDLNRCKAHNQTPNAEAFDCINHYSNLEIFSPVKNTISYLNNEGGVSGLNHKIQQAMQSCESSHSSAELCCGDSMSCGLGGEQGNKGQYLKTITNMTQIINSAGGLPEKCNALKNISRAGAARL